MEDFVFHNPTKIVFGRDRIDSVGDEARRYGTQVLVVYGKHSAKKYGYLQRVIGSLQNNDLHVSEFRGIPGNPTLTKVEEAIDLARKKHIEVICALGGGSVIDAAKAIACGVSAQHSVWKFFIGKKPVKKTLPVIAIPTLAASGSETNGAMVLSHTEKKTKLGYANRHLYPKVAIMDPCCTFTASPAQTAYGAIDAMSHLFEFFMSHQQKNVPIQTRYMLGLAQTIRENCEHCLREPENYDARANLLWAAALALNGLSAAGLGKIEVPIHLIEHSLSALYDVPHGAGLSVIIPGWLRAQDNNSLDRVHQFIQALFPGKTATDMTAVADIFENWFISLGAPTRLQDLGIAYNKISEIAANSQTQAKTWRMPQYNPERVAAILSHCCR